jgi:hypothetical protein
MISSFMCVAGNWPVVMSATNKDVSKQRTCCIGMCAPLRGWLNIDLLLHAAAAAAAG